MRLSYRIVIISISVIILGGGIWNFFNHQYRFVSYQGIRDLHDGRTISHDTTVHSGNSFYHHTISGIQDNKIIFDISATTTPEIWPLSITSNNFFMSGGYHRLSVRFDIITQGTNSINYLPENLTIESYQKSVRGPITTQRVTLSYTDTLDQKTTLSLLGKESCPWLRPIRRSHTMSCHIEGILTIILPTQDQLQPLTVQGASQYQSLL